MITLSALGFLPFGFLVGALARVLAGRRLRGGWMGPTLAGGCGALAGNFCDRWLGLCPEEGPQGFAASLLGALLFVVAYFVVFRRPASDQEVRPVRPSSVAPPPVDFLDTNEP